MFQTDKYVNFSNVFSQYKEQLTNRPQIITNQTDHRRTLGTLERP